MKLWKAIKTYLTTKTHQTDPTGERLPLAYSFRCRSNEQIASDGHTSPNKCSKKTYSKIKAQHRISETITHLVFKKTSIKVLENSHKINVEKVFAVDDHFLEVSLKMYKTSLGYYYTRNLKKMQQLKKSQHKKKI